MNPYSKGCIWREIMKKFLAVFLVAVFLACFSCFVVGCNEKSSKGSSSTENPTEGIIYEVDPSGEFAVVVNYKGDEENVVIASTYNGVPVTKIGEEAFFVDPHTPPFAREKPVIKSVVMPQSITEIGERAFAYTYLSKVEIPDRVTVIEERAFYSCTSLTSVEIGKSVENIGGGAFLYCDKLVEVINKSSHITVEKGIPSNGYLGYYALSVSNCDDTYVSKLSNDNGYIVYTEGEEKILVGYNGSQTNLVLPDYITQIYQSAFGCCEGLTSVVIGDSVTNIAIGAFRGCYSITSITFKDTSNWFAWDRQTQIEGDIVDVTDPSQNAINLTDTYCSSYWYKE